MDNLGSGPGMVVSAKGRDKVEELDVELVRFNLDCSEKEDYAKF